MTQVTEALQLQTTTTKAVTGKEKKKLCHWGACHILGEDTVTRVDVWCPGEWENDGQRSHYKKE